MKTTHRHNIKTIGSGTQAMLLAHGFGCDQNMWRLVTPAFENNFKMTLFDYVGHGQSDFAAYDRHKYATLNGYADDVLEICREQDLRDVTFVGHSVSGAIGILAAIREPSRFKRLVLVSPSPCYVNEGDYVGGFTRQSIDELLNFLDNNHLGWSSAMAPAIMGNTDRPALGAELTNSFCRTDPEIAKHFAKVTFLSDSREDLPRVNVPTLILQCSRDIIAPQCVGEYMHRHLRGSELTILAASGHCPHLSAPDETAAAIQDFVKRN